MKTRQKYIFLLIFILLIVYCILCLIGIAVSQKFEIDEGYTLLEIKNLSSELIKIETAKIKEREQQLFFYAVLNYFGIFSSVLGVVFLCKKKKSNVN